MVIYLLIIKNMINISTLQQGNQMEWLMGIATYFVLAR